MSGIASEADIEKMIGDKSKRFTFMKGRGASALRSTRCRQRPS